MLYLESGRTLESPYTGTAKKTLSCEKKSRVRENRTRRTPP